MIQTIDLFAGCGGLTEGFEASGRFHTLAGVEWESEPCLTLSKRLNEKWSHKDAKEKVLRFDIQRIDELFNGWSDDPEYGSGGGLNALINQKKVDLIVGGPPCQAYSLAGRIRDGKGMQDDYRNFLFESYLKVVERTRPKAFLFENVEGMLSAKPGGVSIIQRITKDFDAIGYTISEDLRRFALVNVADFGVPQNRKRVFILGLDARRVKGNPKDLLAKFYNEYLSRHLVQQKSTVAEAFDGLPELPPMPKVSNQAGRRMSHSVNGKSYANHIPRFHSKRDQEIFSELAEDKRKGALKYGSTESLKELYFEKTGKRSNVHKYYVLDPKAQSNTIPAHLYKDGLRHIHPDPNQARSITPREAARLQSFPDDFIFEGSMGAQFKMIGNAVPPLMAKKLAIALGDFYKDHL